MSRKYKRISPIGSDFVAGSLLAECSECGAAISDEGLHDRWHELRSRSTAGLWTEPFDRGTGRERRR